MSQTYDDDFRVDSQTVGTSTVLFGYDLDGLLTSAGSLSLTRDPLNGLLTGTAQGVVTTTQTYNAFGELDTDDAQVSSSSVYANSYVRDNLGRITQKTETIQGTTTVYDYHYDLAGRLEQVDEDGFVAPVYAYDPNGNRLSVTEGAVVTSGTYDAQDRLQTYGTKTYTHNAAGDLTQVVDSALPAGQQTTLYTYDDLGNLTHVSLPDGRSIEYVIDGQSRRIGKKVDGTLVQGWLYQDQLNPVAELDGAGNVVARFVYGTRPNVPDYVERGGATYRVVADHLGSPRLLVDPTTGTVAQRLDFDEFGQVTQDTNAGFQPFGFAGGLHDGDTGLVRFGARDYDAEIGRWTTKDPIRFEGGANLYDYSTNDPVNWFDLDGLDPSSPIVIVPPGKAVPIQPTTGTDPSPGPAPQAVDPSAGVSAATRQLFKRGAKARRGLNSTSQAIGSALCKRGADSCAADASSGNNTSTGAFCQCFTAQCNSGVPPSPSVCSAMGFPGCSP